MKNSTVTILKLYNTAKNDQSGAAVFTCDGSPITAIWGQDANAGNPTPTSGISMDVGYLMIPRCLDKLILANDNRELTEPSTPVIIDVLLNDAGYLCSVDTYSLKNFIWRLINTRKW